MDCTGAERADQALGQNGAIAGEREPHRPAGQQAVAQRLQRRQAELPGTIEPGRWVERGVEVRQLDGLEQLGRVDLIEEVSECQGIVVDDERLPGDGLEVLGVDDQDVRVELPAATTAVFGRTLATARQGEPAAGQRKEVDADPVALRLEAATRGTATIARLPGPPVRSLPWSARPGDSRLDRGATVR